MEKQEIEQKNQELFTELAKYQKDSKEYRDVVSKIVENNVGLVRTIAKKYFVSKKYPTINDDDLVSAGYLGMLNAIKAFNPAKGVFGTYAGRAIENEIFRHFHREQKREMPSLQDNIGQKDEEKLEDVVASPINVETDFIEKQERQAQIALLKERVNQLPERQREVLTAKYFSGEGALRGVTLAGDFECSRQNISYLEKAGIANLQKMYNAELNSPQPEEPEINLTAAEKIKTKAVLKDLILTELPLGEKKTMLCKFYSPTPKTNAQVAQEVNFKKRTVELYLVASYKKLCTLCDSVRNTKHLRSILEFIPEETAKEC